MYVTLSVRVPVKVGKTTLMRITEIAHTDIPVENYERFFDYLDKTDHEFTNYTFIFDSKKTIAEILLRFK